MALASGSGGAGAVNAAHYQLERLYSVAAERGEAPATPVSMFTFQYDSLGNKTQDCAGSVCATSEYDLRGRVVTHNDGLGRTVGYFYDNANQVTRQVQPSGAAVDYEYDLDGQQTRILDPRGGNPVSMEYDALGRQTQLTQPNGVVVTSTYDAVGNLLTQTQVDGNGQNVLSQSFVYDAGNRKSSQSETQGTGAAVTTLFAYDKQDRLLGSERSDGKRVTYGYDGAGNRTSQSDCSNGSCVNSTWVYNQFNQVVSLSVDGVTTTYSHDRDGNRVGAVSPTEKSSFEWNAEGKLTNAWVQILQGGSWVSKDGKAEAYEYDSMGRRTKTYTLDPDIPTYPTLTRETVYGRGWEELQRLDGANTSNPTTTDLLSLQGGLVPRKLASYAGTNASATRASYYQLDALGSGRAVTGAGGAVQGDFASFSDFGTRLSTTDQPLTPSYTGYEHDAYTGLEYAKNRYYDPQTASFISSDPYPVDPSDLLGMNLYNYVQGNPVNSTDPLGWFVITGFSTSRIYFKTEQNDTRSSISREFDTNWRRIIITTGRRGTNNPRYSETTPIDVNSPGYGPMCPATIGTSSICQTNMLNKIATMTGQRIYNYTKAGVVPVNDLKGILQPLPTPTPAPRYDRNKAVDYAIQWSVDNFSNSSKYYTFVNDESATLTPSQAPGSDCTNFVSQALWAGGIRIDNDDNYPDWNSAKAELANGSFDYNMLAWIRADNLYELLTNKSIAQKTDVYKGTGTEHNWGAEKTLDADPAYQTWLQTISGIAQVGDLVFYQWDQDNSAGGNPWDHVSIITNMNGNVNYYGDNTSEQANGINVTEHGTTRWINRQLPRLLGNTNAKIRQITVLHITY